MKLFVIESLPASFFLILPTLSELLLVQELAGEVSAVLGND